MKAIRIMLLVALTAMSGQVFAEKVAVLAIQQALLASEAAASFRAELKEEFAAEQSKLLDLEKQAKDAQAKLQSNRDLASSEQQQQMRLQFQKVFAEYQRLGQELQQKRMQREQAFVGEMKPKLDKVLQQLIAKEGYDLIVARDATLYVKKELDITAKVVELLNKQ